jgi:hypothetical protein
MLRGEALCKIHGYGGDLLFTLRENHDEEEFISLGNDLHAFVRRDQRNGGR